MRLFDKLSWLSPETSTVENFGDAYDQLRQFMGDFLTEHEIRGMRRGVYGREDQTTEFEDLLIGADVLFTSLKAVLESMNEAQEIINNWDEETPEESPEYAQALGEVMMSKRLFIKIIRNYEKMEDLRAYHMRESLERPYQNANVRGGVAPKDTIRHVFSNTQSQRPDGDRRDIPHPRYFSGYTTTTNRISNIRATTLPKDWKLI